jgi:hypothetical protein
MSAQDSGPDAHHLVFVMRPSLVPTGYFSLVMQMA